MSNVFTDGMSSPDSMMEEATRTSYFRLKKSHMAFSSWSERICPCASAKRAQGSRRERRSRVSGRERTLLCT